MSSIEYTQEYWLANINYDKFLDVYLELLKKYNVWYISKTSKINTFKDLFFLLLELRYNNSYFDENLSLAYDNGIYLNKINHISHRFSNLVIEFKKFSRYGFIINLDISCKYLKQKLIFMLNKEIKKNISMINTLDKQLFNPLNESYFLEIFKRKEEMGKKMLNSTELDIFLDEKEKFDELEHHLNIDELYSRNRKLERLIKRLL